MVMTKYIFISLVVIHALIHLLGFIKAIRPNSLPLLSQRVSKLAGILWLSTTVIMLWAIVIYVFGYDYWWIFGAIGLLLSQTLIIRSWKDSKFGTFANLLLLLALIIGFSNWDFNQMVGRESVTILSDASKENLMVTEQMLEPLPPVVQNWLRKTECIGKPIINDVHIRQTGEMLLKPGTSWNLFSAEQWVTVYPQAFLWKTRVTGPMHILLKGRDKYQDGQGNMLIKFLATFPLVDARGPEINQAAMLRYLSEIVWYPTAALSDYIEWHQIDDFSAKATIHNGNMIDSGVFHFNKEGLVTSFKTKRYYYRKGQSTLETWVADIDDKSFFKFDGILVPRKAKITWKLKQGDFTWFRLELTDLKYNVHGNR